MLYVLCGNTRLEQLRCLQVRGLRVHPASRAAATDVFVYISAVRALASGVLNEGQAIEFELVSNRGKTSREESEGSALTTPDCGHAWDALKTLQDDN